MSLVTGLARLPVARGASVPSVNVIQHPKLIPVVIAAVVAVIAVWGGISLSRWRRITWREHMDAPVSLVPKGARRGGTGTAWKVFARHQEVADPSLVQTLESRHRHLRRVLHGEPVADLSRLPGVEPQLPGELA
jgi:hypothetical protein